MNWRLNLCLTLEFAASALSLRCFLTNSDSHSDYFSETQSLGFRLKLNSAMTAVIELKTYFYCVLNDFFLFFIAACFVSAMLLTLFHI